MNTLTDTLQFDRFLRAYMECAVWTSSEELEGAEKGFAPATIAAMTADCAKFLQAVQGKIDALVYDLPSFGHDFWLTRNHHGSGYWDSPELYGVEGSEILTNAAHEFPEVDLYIGDDGLIYQSPG